MTTTPAEAAGSKTSESKTSESRTGGSRTSGSRAAPSSLSSRAADIPWATDVVDTTEEEIAGCVSRARSCFEEWSTWPFSRRRAFLKQVRHLLAKRAREMADVIVGDTGKIPAEAMLNEIVVTCELMAYYERHGARILATEPVGPGLLLAYKQASIRYEPLGVVGVISPWNYPLILSMGPVVTALFAGNTVILKPSEVTPHVGLAVRDLFLDAADAFGASASERSLLAGLVQVVTGAGSVGDALVRSGVDKIVFTGSVRTGQAVMRAAADSLTPVLLELGGKDPMIVAASANLDRAAHGAVWGAFTNAGQTCMAVERVYVEESVYDDFVDKVVAITNRLRQGSGAGHDLGAITWKRQFDVVWKHLQDATAKGAKVLAGGNPVVVGGRQSLEPTVLVDVDHTMAVMKEETFGPILPIMAVHDLDEALDLANDSVYGLSSSVWASDRQSIEKLTSGMRAGAVCVNDCMVSYAMPALPFGGVGHSGIGRTHGYVGLREMSRTKAVASDRLGLKQEPHWLPLGRWTGSLAETILWLRHRVG